MTGRVPRPPVPPGAGGGDDRAPSAYALELQHLTGERPRDAAGRSEAAALERTLLDHRPGALPLRPLRLGEVLDVSFSIVRHARAATIGAALVASALALALPLLLAALVDLPGRDWASVAPDAAVVGLLESGTVLVGSLVLSTIGTALLTGVVAHVVHAAALGHLLTLEEAWRRTHGRRWAVLGASLLVGLLALVPVVVVGLLFVGLAAVAPRAVVVLVGLLVVPLALAALALVAVRVGLTTVPVIALEGVGPGRAFGRSLRLTRRSFWRLLGVLLVVFLVGGIVLNLLTALVAGAGAVAGSSAGTAGPWIELAVLAVAGVVPSALLSAYTAVVAVVLYLDLRIRGEGYDVQLRSGLERRR